MEENMKNTLYAVLAAALFTALAFSGCDTEDRTPVNYGDNLISEAAILAAAWMPGETTVVKEGNRYRVSGKITKDPDYLEDIYCVKLYIKADPADANKYFAGVKRLTMNIEFPDSAVKPYSSFGTGFHLYLENIKATANTAQYAGSWQSEPVEEYNATGGVGIMTVDRKLAEGINTITNKNNVGDYHHIVISVRFPSSNSGTVYSYYISNVGVYGIKTDNTYPNEALGEIPIIHANSRLSDAQYTVDETAAALRIVPEYQGTDPDTGIDSRESYTYEWYSNTAHSTTGGALIPEDQIGNNSGHPLGWNAGTSFIPPTGTAGTFYYYVVISYKGRSTTSRIVTIRINEP